MRHEAEKRKHLWSLRLYFTKREKLMSAQYFHLRGKLADNYSLAKVLYCRESGVS